MFKGGDQLKWTKEAEERVLGAPFFIRGFARKKAEEMAESKGKSVVEVEDIEEAKGKKDLEDLSSLELTVEGVKNTKYKEIKPCGGLRGCPLTLFDDEKVVLTLENTIKKLKLEEFINQQIDGPVLYHHKFKAAVSGCPNCCSQPQIKDIGIIGYSRPKINKGHCMECQQCIQACPEKLVVVDGEPSINYNECIDCGRCIRSCPTSSIIEEEVGYRIIIGGRLGRRPYLAHKLTEVNSLTELEEVLEEVIELYQSWRIDGKNFSRTVEEIGTKEIINLFQGVDIK